MNNIYLAEQCPRARQDLQKLVNLMLVMDLLNEEFNLNLAGGTE